ncbi:hypothetical protein H6P81_001888 [Aristolochia fimbriata]|uniref:Choline transporter-like protein n=1 Tax=Aristolochia fimbriata TaxID=158543 RepID=A0AAV7F853_ARIFI|nr:hypothetical protein H6P81_001888 [Aristolochia fimbriata]
MVATIWKNGHYIGPGADRGSVSVFGDAAVLAGESGMGAVEPVPEAEAVVEEEEKEKEEREGEGKEGDETSVQREVNVSRLQARSPAPALQVVVPPQPLQSTQQQPSLASLNSTVYTNRISLLLFLLHSAIAVALVSFLIYKAVEGFLKYKTRRKEERLLRHWLPQIEGSAILSIVLAFAWQKALRKWPAFMVRFIVWSTFALSFSAGTLLLCFSMPGTDGFGVVLVGFAIGNGLYACWVTQRLGFTAKVLTLALQPVSKFKDLNEPTYWMMGVGFMWMSLWTLAVLGSLNFYFPPLIVILLVLSLAWTTEVMRNVVNLTVSRVIALYYLRGMQSDTFICFQRALTRNLGSASLGSLFIPAIEALRIVARVLNLIEGEDEFMFSCAHCCLRVMECIFRYGNGWAFVHVAAYGHGLVRASQTTWALFEKQEMEPIVDSDITTSLCFLAGVASGSACVIFAGSWTFSEHKSYTATIALLAFFLGYLITRISMAVPHACVSCYYVCYAENPGNRLFDSTIPDRLKFIKEDRDAATPTPRFRRRPPV